MKALKIVLIVVSSLLLIGGAGYLYASSGIKSKPGYATLATPKGNSVNALLSVNVGPGGVKPARWLIDKVVDSSNHVPDVPERILKSALKELQGVQLHVYDVGSNRKVFDNAIADSMEKLKDKSWKTLATVREDDVNIAVLQFGEGAMIAGLSIMASTPEKAVFLNLVGPFDTDALANTARHL